MDDLFYYDEKGNVVFTEKYLRERGFCCAQKCTNCPFEPKHTLGNKNLKKEIINGKNTE